MDTKGSELISAVESFWNGWVTARKENNGNIEFIPNLRMDSYDSCFVPYEHLKSVIVYNRNSEEITKELWKTFEVCDLMYKKSREPDTSCHHDIFFEYVNELRKQRNDLYLTWEEWEQKCT
jgi:predicted DNA-binding protein (UPF0278 family)